MNIKSQDVQTSIVGHQFESLKMLEDEIIVEFNVHLLDIVSEYFALGEKIS